MILILDFGSQYTPLIARRIRELGVYATVCATLSWQAIQDMKPHGIILSGGPYSVLDKALQVDTAMFDGQIPILGICYGMQLMAHHHKCTLAKHDSAQYGAASMSLLQASPLWEGLSLSEPLPIWMSHQDSVTSLSADWMAIGATPSCPIVALQHRDKPFFGLQFHPEVIHTDRGSTILNNFLNHCHCPHDWQPAHIVDAKIEAIQKKVGNDSVLCAISGGIDSTTLAVLCEKAIPHQLTCLFIDHGLLRKNERQSVETIFKTLGLTVRYVDAKDLFLKGLKEVIDPEEKRKKIGAMFIDVFKKEVQPFKTKHRFLAQGTLYSDVIESATGHASIKSHHNVGGLPKDLGFELLEPFRNIFKDEVRLIAKHLNMPADIIKRHPFPGPGLAIRILGAITQDRIYKLQEADAIVISEMKQSGYYDKVWQSFAVLLPIQTVGVKGDQRAYEDTIAIRVVDSEDAMTAKWVPLPADLLETLSSRIMNEVPHVSRVVYDISSKPPSTIEWE